VVRLGGPGERPGQAELLQCRLRHALDARRVGGLPARVRIIGEAADGDRVRGRSVAGDPDQVQMQCLAELVEPRRDDRLLVDAVVGAGSLEEAKFSSVRNELAGATPPPDESVSAAAARASRTCSSCTSVFCRALSRLVSRFRARATFSSLATIDAFSVATESRSETTAAVERRRRA
jgi:hypothetical protein